MKLKPLVIALAVVGTLCALGGGGYGLYRFGMQRGMAMNASSTAAPSLNFGAISGVTEITSTSSQNVATIALQFDPSRKIDKAAQDVQSAINAAIADLPSDLPTLPSIRKVNPAAAPILVMVMTSKTLPTSVLYDAADTVIVQRLSQVDGVAEVSVSGGEQPLQAAQLDAQLDHRHSCLVNKPPLTCVSVDFELKASPPGFFKRQRPSVASDARCPSANKCDFS